MLTADEQSLRPWLARLADSGRLVEIAGELDPAAGLAAQLVAHRSEPVRIARVRGSDLPVVANLLSGRSLIAEALGVAEPQLGRHLTRAIDAPIEPRLAGDGPCQAIAEEHPDLAQLPIPRWFEHEGGPYITAGCIVARDPETGERNWSIARVRPLGGSRALVGIAPNHHLAVAARAARERGGRLPIAVTVGNHPALLVAACLYLARGEDELRVAGALLGEPVELVRCRHVPLEVPAGCELVLEGELDLDATVEEGPVSEFHGGYERYGRAATATFSCLTRRSDALYQAILPGFHPEHAMLGGVAIAAGLERRLRQSVPSVLAVAVPESGAGRLTAVVALGPHEHGDARTVALAALEAVNLVKLVTVVDGDVDPWDDAGVAHAVATRVHFDRDLHVLPGMRADRAEPLEHAGTIAKLAIDATRHQGDRNDWILAEPPHVTIEAGTVVGYLVARGLVPARRRAHRRGTGGRGVGHRPGRAGPGIALVVKQALPRLRVADEWLAPARRTDTEAAALRLAAPSRSGSRASGRRQRRRRARPRPAARPRGLAQLAIRITRRPPACDLRPLGRRDARPAARRYGRRCRGCSGRSATTRPSPSCGSIRITES